VSFLSGCLSQELSGDQCLDWRWPYVGWEGATGATLHLALAHGSWNGKCARQHQEQRFIFCLSTAWLHSSGQFPVDLDWGLSEFIARCTWKMRDWQWPPYWDGNWRGQGGKGGMGQSNSYCHLSIDFICPPIIRSVVMWIATTIHHCRFHVRLGIAFQALSIHCKGNPLRFRRLPVFRFRFWLPPAFRSRSCHLVSLPQRLRSNDILRHPLPTRFCSRLHDVAWCRMMSQDSSSQPDISSDPPSVYDTLTRHVCCTLHVFPNFGLISYIHYFVY